MCYFESIVGRIAFGQLFGLLVIMWVIMAWVSVSLEYYVFQWSAGLTRKVVVLKHWVMDVVSSNLVTRYSEICGKNSIFCLVVADGWFPWWCYGWCWWVERWEINWICRSWCWRTVMTSIVWIRKEGQGLLWGYLHRSRWRSSSLVKLREFVIREVVVRNLVLQIFVIDILS